jgi:hypothetical protein
MQLISGVVGDLVIQRGEEVIVGGEALRTAGAAASVGLAAAGLAGAATGALLASGVPSDSVEFFACTVGGRRIAGRFSKVTFKNGDKVDVVGESQLDETVAAMAVRRRSSRMLWMFPHCSRGGRAHWMYAWRMAVALSISWALLLCITFGVMMALSNNGHSPAFKAFVFGVEGVIAILIGCYMSFSTALRWRPLVERAESIFAALGYRDPRRVDLERQHDLYCKAHGGKWPYLKDAPWVYHYLDEA